MVLNGSDLINNPWNTTFGPYTNLLGNGFWLIPISFIAVALYIKTRNPTLVSAYLMGSGALLSGGNLFLGNPEMLFVYIILTVVGLIGLIISIFFIKE